MAKRDNEHEAAGAAANRADPGRADARRGTPADAPSEQPAVEAPAAPAGPETNPAAAAVAPPPATTPPPKKRGKGRLVLAALLLAGIGFGAYEGHGWWTHGRFMVETEDAYVATDITTLAAKVSGYVVSVDVSANQAVKAGDAIAHLDPGDYELALQSAENKIRSQDAAILRIARQTEAAEASVAEANAQVLSATARLRQAQAAFERQSQLAASRTSSQAQLDEAQASRDEATAAVRAAEAGLSAANANVAVLKAQAEEARTARADLVTARDKAARDLTFTVIRAPVDGVVGNRAVEVGAFVQPGQRLAALVPLQSVHVDANFKETQLEGLKAGQMVELTVDALGDERVIEGRVESFAPATGSQFSLLPPENATGNFTKIVQRVPVRISVPADVAAEGVLRPGMSVIAGVDLRTGSATETASR